MSKQSSYSCIDSQGGLLPPDILARIGAESVDGMRPTDFGLPQSRRISEEISQAWGKAQAHWRDFKEAQELRGKDERTGTQLTREKWMMPLIQILGFGPLPAAAGPEIDGKTYPIRHFWNNVPFHLLGYQVPIDRRSKGVAGAATTVPHSLVQEFLNRSDDHLWAILSNGLRLRILRDSAALSRQAYLEFDLESMMDSEAYSDFGLLWKVLHVSRFDASRPEECWLEKWTHLASEEGARVLGGLRNGVRSAIETLGQGFLRHPRNEGLRLALRQGDLQGQELYREILRTVYRLLFLFVAEDRNLLHRPEATEEQRNLYFDNYSLSRIRALSDRIRGTGHGDLWHSLSRNFHWLDRGGAEDTLGITVLGSFLWDASSTPHILGPGQSDGSTQSVHLANDDLLTAVRQLSFAKVDDITRAVDYKNLGAEELGSVYESLLELNPTIRAGTTSDQSSFQLATESGNDRKTTGSYYTPDSLVQCLLDSALEPVVLDRLANANSLEQKEQAILSLTVCDPAVGSGHFLIAAAHRLAHHLARIRTGDHEPAPADYRRALRDVIRKCLFGVDMNPMSAELCRVALWMEALEPGQPLSFLDHHIQVGNSLMGVTPGLLAKGIPDDAFKPIEGDEKKCIAELKKKNKESRKLGAQGVAQGGLFGTEEATVKDDLGKKAREVDILEAQDAAQERRRQSAFHALQNEPLMLRRKLAADAWCAAFVWKKDGTALSWECPNSADIQEMLRTANYSEGRPEQVREIQRLAKVYSFFHWHLAFPQVLDWHEAPPVPQEVSI